MLVPLAVLPTSSEGWGGLGRSGALAACLVPVAEVSGAWTSIVSPSLLPPVVADLSGWDMVEEPFMESISCTQ